MQVTEFLDEEMQVLSWNMRGIRAARIRMVHYAPHIEHSLAEFLQKLGIEVECEHMASIAPEPLRRFGFQFSGTRAIITVSPQAPLNG